MRVQQLLVSKQTQFVNVLLQNLTCRCSCALFSAFKPELKEAGLFTVPEGGS